MASYFPNMKINSKFSVEADEMYTVHGHAGDLSRLAILEALRKIIHSRSELQAKHPVSIADFGTADGRASLSLINEMIEMVQTNMEEPDIVVNYNDQPQNDFNLLSEVIHGNTRNPGLTLTGNVYPVMIPRNMYGQCLPDNTVDLAISAAATQYLSKQVCQIKNGVFMGEADVQERALMKEQGKIDWRNFVISRGRELKPGGFVITVNASVVKSDTVATYVDKGLHHLGSFVSDMAREGLITQDEYIATNLPLHHMRTDADFEEPFISKIPEVAELGLELVSMKSMKNYLKHPLFDIARKNDAEKLEYSKRIVAMVYPWMHHVLLEGLSKSRTEAEKEVIIDQYFQRLQDYAFAHSENKPYISVTEVVIHKRPN